MELWTSVIGNRAMESHAREHARNRDAHGRFHRSQIGQESDTKDDDMGNTILGDVTTPAPVVIAGNSGGSDTLKTLITLVLGGLLGGGGLAAGAAATYFLNRTPEVVSEPNASDAIRIGLGRLEDFTNEDRDNQ